MQTRHHLDFASTLSRSRITRSLRTGLTVLAAAAALVLPATGWSAVPSAVGVEGALTSVSGGAAPDGSYNIVFSIYKDAVGGNPIWVEGPVPVSVKSGLFSYALGTKTPLNAATFTGIPTAFFALKVDTDPELTRQAMSSTAFALRAGMADGLDCSGCITVGQLDASILAPYAKTTALAPYAKTTDLAPYAKTTDLVPYAETADLAVYAKTTALAPYAKTADLGVFAKTTDLAPYAKTADLVPYAETADLAVYAKTADLAVYAKTTALAPYAKTTDLAPYAKTADLSVFAKIIDLLPYAKIADLGVFAKTTDLAPYAKTADLSAYAKTTAIPTSVNGLAGGTISSAVTVNGTVTAPAFTQNGKAVCDVSGNCADSDTLAALKCAASQSPVWNGSAWACSASPVPVAACNGPFQALQWDGAAWKCITITSTGLSGGLAKAFEAKDSWGFVWDGIERQGTTWTAARDACAAKGGRLPTMTELWRVSGGAGQLGEVGTSYDSNYLWSLIAWNKTAHGSLRLTDGAITYYADTTPRPYRCVWSNNALTYFSGNNCFGPPGSECYKGKTEGGKMSMDAYERPVVSYVAANDECNFYHAHLASERDYSEYATTLPGLGNGTNAWQWTSDSVRYDLVNLVRWSGVDTGFDDGGSTYNTWAGRTDQDNGYKFRCKGVNTGIGPHPNTIPTDTTYGSEFTIANTNLKSTTKNRAAATHYAALTTCFQQGGHVALENDYMELIRQGLPNGAGVSVPIWTSDWSRYDIVQHVQWAGVDLKYTDWYAEYVSWYTVGTATLPYRCVYYPLDTAYAGPAAVGGVPQCNGTAGGASCFTTSHGGTTKTKYWADKFDRSTANWITANKICNSEGGHMPNAHELAALIREGLPGGSLANYMWTSDAIVYSNSANQFYALGFRWNGTGDATWQDNATNTAEMYKGTAISYYRPYRCVWSNELR